MIRFIILAIVAYVFYRALKSWMFPASDSSKSVSGRNADQLDDVMIKDPFCEVYFPKRNAVHLKFDGEDLYFCSTACKEKYIATQAGNEEKSG